jgi:hypothetical protein
MIQLDFLACLCIPPASKLRTILEREERFWQERRVQEEVRGELFGQASIPRPPAYVSKKSTFDGFEVRVTPSVMIPRRG